jgi:hypothetical protein
MAKDRFPPNVRIPVFLSDPDEPEHRGIGKAWVGIILSLGTAAVIVHAVLLVGNPLVLFAKTPASPVTAAPQDGSGQSMPAIQSTASAQALPPTAREAPGGDELLAAFKTAFESKTEVDQPPTEAMLNQFQAWAANEDAQAQTRPTQPIQDARAQVVQKALPLPKPRPVRADQTARTKDQSVQNAQAPSFLQSFGWRN